MVIRWSVLANSRSPLSMFDLRYMQNTKISAVGGVRNEYDQRDEEARLRGYNVIGLIK